MKKTWMRIAAAAAVVLMCFAVFAGCGKKDDVANFRQPKNGDTIAVLHTNYGDISVEFFDDIAPNAVTNFVTHSEEGYYDNVLFHRVMSNFMIQGGDPDGTGYGGESIWGGKFDVELSDNAYNLRGALCMANSGTPDSNGSQFYIVQQGPISENTFKAYEMYGYTFTDKQKELYMEYGGSPWLDGGYTVFGQVIDGMDVVDAIAAVDTDSNDRPLEDVIIGWIEITTYSAK